MKLPNAEQAVVEIAKLRDYSLNTEHEEGQHKARVFAAALGIDREDAEWLREKLLAAVLQFDCVKGKNTPFGQRYILDFTISKPPLQAQIRSVWNIPLDQTAPRLITCYLL